MSGREGGREGRKGREGGRIRERQGRQGWLDRGIGKEGRKEGRL